MKIRTGMMSLMAASAFVCFGAIAAEAPKSTAPTKADEVPDCCKPDFLKAPLAKDAAKPAEVGKTGMGGCGGHGAKEGGCGGHGAKEGGCGGHGGMMGAQPSCETSAITLVLPCGHDIKIVVAGDSKPVMMGGHGAKEGGCGGHGAKEGGCSGHGAKAGGCGGHGAKEGGCGGHGGMMGGCKQNEKKPAPSAAPLEK